MNTAAAPENRDDGSGASAEAGTVSGSESPYKAKEFSTNRASPADHEPRLLL